MFAEMLQILSLAAAYHLTQQQEQPIDVSLLCNQWIAFYFP